MKIEIVRLQEQEEKQTLGELYVVRDNSIVFKCATLELSWKDNQRRISCIPQGTYKARLRSAKDSPSRSYDHIHVENVPNRTWILIHSGNFHWHIQGCILVGNEHRDINHNGLLDVPNSRLTMNALINEVKKHVNWGDEFEVTIKYREG